MKYPKVQKYCLMSVKGCYTGELNKDIPKALKSKYYHYKISIKSIRLAGIAERSKVILQGGRNRALVVKGWDS